VRVTCWGTRGSIPAPGPETVGFGGNTPCLEIRCAAGRSYILDAGTGIRALGSRLAEDGPTDVDLFLTHFHWDHIQGLPFFRPLHDPAARIRIHGPSQDGRDVETLLRAQMAPEFFPVPYSRVAATLSFHHVTDEPWTDGVAEVAAHRVRHAGYTCGYRVRCNGVMVGYVPDNELVGGSYGPDPAGWYAGLVAFLEGVDVLFHDAMYTDDEYHSMEGWGHSTFSQAVRLAEDAGAGRLFFFHHAPDRDDDALARQVDAIRDALARRGSTLQVDAAAEGLELRFPTPEG
jgi:phosphoribosyl 1,2-cyclic phosphodiesterase